MILLTKINLRDKFWVNENLIESMEETPDTMLTLVTGKKLAVSEPAEKVAEMINRNWQAARPAAAVLVDRRCWTKTAKNKTMLC
jgi:flagellar protein FlbD